MIARFLLDNPSLLSGFADAAAAEGVVEDEDVDKVELVDDEVRLASVVLDEIGREDVGLEVDKSDVEVVLLDEVGLGE